MSRTKGAKDRKSRKLVRRQPVLKADYDLIAANGGIKKVAPSLSWYSLMRPMVWLSIGFAIAYFLF